MKLEDKAEVQAELTHYFRMGMLDDAEQLIDELMAADLENLAAAWQLPKLLVLHILSGSYNNIGMLHFSRAERPYQLTEDITIMQAAARHAERCHEKALDLFDISIEEIFYLPADHPLSKNFIFSLWGLGLASYFLERHAESCKYLQQCLRIPPEDEQAATWQADASNYLHKIEQKPAEIIIKTTTVLPHLLDHQLLCVRGTLVGWDTYAKPMLDEYAVRVTDEDVARLAQLKITNPAALSGHTLILRTDDTCDLYRPLRLIEIAHAGQHDSVKL